MKIAIPVNNEKMEGGISMSFGRAPFYLFYDTESENGDFVLNEAAESQGGAGIRAAQFIVDNKVEAVLTPRCGENSANVLKRAGIKLYETVGDSITENIEAFSNSKLAQLDNIHPGFHGSN